MDIFEIYFITTKMPAILHHLIHARARV